MKLNARLFQVLFIIMISGMLIGNSWAQDSSGVRCLQRLYFANTQAVIVHGDIAYVANGKLGIQAIDISAPTTPRVIGSCPYTGNITQTALDGNYLYLM